MRWGRRTREFLWQVACGLGTTPREDADVPWLWRQIADRVAENRVQQVDTVLLVDDAGQAGPDLVTQFVRLARLDATPAARWTIVLAAEPAQAARWNETLRNLVDLRIDVRALDGGGHDRLRANGARRRGPVRAAVRRRCACKRCTSLRGGVPRQVARLADFALLAGAAAGVETIDAAIVEAANEEIAWPAAAAAY